MGIVGVRSHPGWSSCKGVARLPLRGRIREFLGAAGFDFRQVRIGRTVENRAQHANCICIPVTQEQELDRAIGLARLEGGPSKHCAASPEASFPAALRGDEGF